MVISTCYLFVRLESDVLPSFFAILPLRRFLVLLSETPSPAWPRSILHANFCGIWDKSLDTSQSFRKTSPSPGQLSLHIRKNSPPNSRIYVDPLSCQGLCFRNGKTKAIVSGSYISLGQNG